MRFYPEGSCERSKKTPAHPWCRPCTNRYNLDCASLNFILELFRLPGFRNGNVVRMEIALIKRLFAYMGFPDISELISRNTEIIYLLFSPSRAP